MVMIIINSIPMRTLKRGDLMAEEIKRWIAARRLSPGDRLPRESELQKLFSVSKATAREALKSLEVQGFIKISTGPSGGATITDVRFERTFQLLQNYLFFQNVSIEDIYAVRLVTEPELAAGAVPHLSGDDFRKLETSIEFCSRSASSEAIALAQRQEDLRFHDVLAEANPNPLLRFLSQTVNEMIRQVVVVHGRPLASPYRKFGEHNLKAHRAILLAARKGNSNRVRALMREHIETASIFSRKLKSEVAPKLVLEGDMRVPVPLPPDLNIGRPVTP